MNRRFVNQFFVAVIGLSLSHWSPPCTAQDAELASLNWMLQEDVKEIQRQSPLGQLIKPGCPSILSEETLFPPVPVVVTSTGGLKELWLQAASHSEKDLRYEAVMAIARAHSRGMPGFEDTASRLAEMLDSEEADHVLRLAAARALIVLNAQESAPLLRNHCDRLDLAKLIEPALAEWNDAAMHSVWLARLNEKSSRPGLMVLAIQAAAKNRLSEAISPLRQLLLDPTSAPHIRLEAAQALSTLGDDGNTSDAMTLVSGAKSASPFLEHLLAAHLLQRQDGPDAVALLTELSNDPQPVTRAIALGRLVELDPQLTRPVLDDALRHRDPKLRMIAGKALFALRTPADVGRLSALLDDVHTHVRTRAREWMVESDAHAELSESVRKSGMQMLASDRPRGLAQAAVLLGTLVYTPAADRLVDLLDHQAPDVATASAWALRRLAVQETAEAAWEHLRLETEDSLIERPVGGPSLNWRWDMYEQHKHLIELLGLLRYQPADDFFRQYIPRPPDPPAGHPFDWIHCTHRSELRSRAIWALGRIYEDQAHEELVPLLLAQLKNSRENVHVAAICALALGRMKATDAEAELKQFYQPGMTYTQLAPVKSILALVCRVALEQITGATFAPMEVEPYVTPKSTSWFLEPLAD